MDQEPSELLNEPSIIPSKWRWEKLAPLWAMTSSCNTVIRWERLQRRRASSAPSSVHDPSCGTGGFLLSAYGHMKAQPGAQDRAQQGKLREQIEPRLASQAS
jgi:hypothetical protein